nr:RNA-directed DNA polymerase, eukaryota [Tanacetum cinerariifolium]
NGFVLLKLRENSVEVLKILENKLKSMKILENKLESLKLQENQPVDGLENLARVFGGSIGLQEELVEILDQDRVWELVHFLDGSSRRRENEPRMSHKLAVDGNSHKVYGHVVDSFIPLKRSREGKRFGFVRFINVFNVERLVSNLCTIWVGRNKLQANMAKFSRGPLNGSPNSGKHAPVKKNGGNNENGPFASRKGGDFTENAIVLDDDCLHSKDLSKSLIGRVKEIASLSNLKKALVHEGFDDLIIHYMGELWVLLEFANVKSKDAFSVNIGVDSWFSEIRQASMNFTPKGRIVWIEAEGIPFQVWLMNTFKRLAAKWGDLVDVYDEDDSCFHSKRLCVYTKIHSNIFKNIKVVYRGKMYWIRAKEVAGWVPDFLEDSDDECQSEEDNVVQEPLVQDDVSCGDDFEVDEIPETQFDVSPDKNRNDSANPFGIYPLFNKINDVIPNNGMDADSSIKFPPGFTPDAGNRNSNISEGNDRNASGANSQQEKNAEIPVVQNEVRDVMQEFGHVGWGNSTWGGRAMDIGTVPVCVSIHERAGDANDSDSQASASSRSKKFKQSVAQKSGGSILCLMEELVRVGQSMGYNMEGCMNNMTEIIESQEATGRDKCLLWNYLTHVSNQWDGEVIMMGDFNEVRCKSDRFSSIFNAHGAEVFNSFINNAGLVEVPLGGSAYTWSHRSANKMSKIDRFLISDNLLSSYPNISAVTLERFLSDHRPILLRESYYDYGPIPFHFFHHWLVMDGFDTFVIDVWRNIPGDKSNAMRNVMNKLKCLKVRIRGWLSRNMNSNSVEITRLKRELTTLDESIDNGTGTKEINIRGVLIDGIWIEEPIRVKNQFFQHFKDRFDKPKEDRVRIDMCFSRSLSSEQQETLKYMVSMEEVKRVVWDCGTDKSPGPDGFSFGFYRHFWPTIGYEVFEAVKYFFTHNDIPNGCNSTFIALIPKISDAKMVKDFRPISLIGNDVLLKFGFGNKWRLWIQSCLRSSRGSIIVNGSPTEEFQFFKGLKQGDPLSPFLFILVMESLHLSFQWVVDAGMFTGIKLCSSLNLSRLFYADDAMFVGQWCDSNISTLVHVLECFHRASGLKINMSKSKILGIHVEALKVEQAASKLGCLILNTPFTYLGTKVGCSMSRLNDWDEVVEKVMSRLSKWKMKSLSIGGRLTLLKSVLGSIPIFHTSIFKVPSKILNKLESIRNRFFKGQDIGSYKASWGVNFFEFLKVELGNGLAISFWEDRWFEGYVFKDRFPRLYALENNKKVTVGDKLQDASLDSSFRRTGRDDSEQLQFDELAYLIVSISLGQNSDRYIWSLSNSGAFSVASLRRLIDENRYPCGSSRTRWVKFVPIKVNVLAWKIKMDALPTKFNILRRGIEIESMVIGKILSWWNVDYMEVNSYEEWSNWLISLRLTTKHKELLQGVFYVLWWSMWSFRNKVLFDVKKPSQAVIFDSIVSSSFYWCYKTWVHHGESDLPPPPPVIDNTRQPQMSDMIALLNDLSYIPPNNEQNEPTQRDIGETSNEPTQAKPNEFKEFYASANEELYPGCDYVTRLDFMAKFTYFKVKGKLNDFIINEMLEFFQYVFPTMKGYKLPPLYYVIKKTFKTIGLGYRSIHACVNDCFLFWGDNKKDVHFCPVCKTSKWKDSNTPRKKVPKKVLHYFLIIPRLQCLYKSSHTAKEMNWHATGKCTEPGKMQHPIDGRAWKNFDTKYPNFAKEPRNVRLGLAANGFNPFDNLNIDVYLRPLIDDLKVLWALKDGQSTEVDAPPDIIDLDEDDDIIDDEDALPHDLADFDDDDGVDMSADVARDHDGDGGDDDRPPTHHIPIDCEGCFANRCKGTRKPNLGGRKAGRLHTFQETRNLGLKKITDDKGPVPIRFEWDDKKPLMPLAHWVINPETGTYDVESIRQRHPENITPADWDAQIAFWNDPRNKARAAQNCQNRAKSTVDEMLRLQALGSNTPSGVPTLKKRSMPWLERASSGGTFPVLVGYCRDGPQMSSVRPRLNVRTTPPMSKSSKRRTTGVAGAGMIRWPTMRTTTRMRRTRRMAIVRDVIYGKSRFVDYIVFIRILDDLALSDQMR